MNSGGTSTFGTNGSSASTIPPSVISTGEGSPNRSPTGTITTAPSKQHEQQGQLIHGLPSGGRSRRSDDRSLQRPRNLPNRPPSGKALGSRYRSARRIARCGIPASGNSGPYASYPSRS